jgi:H+/Cl- antiporter ClcA
MAGPPRRVHCVECGAEMYSHQAECPGCGSANVLLVQQASPPPPPPLAAQQPTASPSVSAPGLAALGILLPLIGFLVSLIYCLSDNPVSKAKGKRGIQWALGGVLLGFIISFGLWVLFYIRTTQKLQAIQETYQEVSKWSNF